MVLPKKRLYRRKNHKNKNRLNRIPRDPDLHPVVRRRSSKVKRSLIEMAANLIRSRSRIVVLTGAGISVSCGIPDFRSRRGLYSRLKREYPELGKPEDMFDLEFFHKNPVPFFTFAKEIFPGQYKPSVTHRFIRLLEKKCKLLRNYTQNIDTLERAAGISRVYCCHGSFETASCLNCKRSYPGEALREAIMSQRIPQCPFCSPGIGLKGTPVEAAACESNNLANSKVPLSGVVKPDIVFFGETLPPAYFENVGFDREEVDLIIVIGTSLQVPPVARIPNYFPADTPKILINLKKLKCDVKFDVELIDKCDGIVEDLCSELGWDVESVEEEEEVMVQKNQPQASSVSKADFVCLSTVPACGDESGREMSKLEEPSQDLTGKSLVEMVNIREDEEFGRSCG